MSQVFQYLSVDFHAGLSAKLFSDEVGVVAGVDVVVIQRLVHVLKKGKPNFKAVVLCER